MRSPRIALKPTPTRGLRLWAALEDREPSEILSQLVMDSLPARVQGMLTTKEPGSPKPAAPRIAKAKEPRTLGPLESQMWGTSGVPRSRKRIADDQPALDHIMDRIAQGASAKELELEMACKPNSAVRAIVKKLKHDIH